MLWLEHISYPWDEGSANYTETVSRFANSEPHPRSPAYVLHFQSDWELCCWVPHIFLSNWNRHSQDKRCLRILLTSICHCLVIVLKTPFFFFLKSFFQFPFNYRIHTCEKVFLLLFQGFFLLPGICLILKFIFTSKTFFFFLYNHLISKLLFCNHMCWYSSSSSIFNAY